MNRPPLEMADIVRHAGPSFVEREDNMNIAGCEQFAFPRLEVGVDTLLIQADTFGGALAGHS